MMARPRLALAATLLVQLLATMSLTCASVLAPAVAPALGLPPERIGWYAGLAYLMAMLSGLRSGVWVVHLGGVRLSQLSLLACAAGLLLAVLVPPAALLLSAMLIGAGYGLSNPAAAQVLAHHAPASATGLFFSIKQAGVPLGVALCGLLMPWGLVELGWQATVAWLGAAGLLTAALLQASQQRLDTPRPAAPASGMSWLGPLATVWRAPELRLLSLLSMTYAMTQQIFITFVVALLHFEGGLSLAAAAGVLSLSQVVSMFSRVGLGHLADRRMAPARLLGLLGLAMAASVLWLASAGVSGSWGWAALAAMACGMTTMGWNGVFYAALVRAVPREQLAAQTGATQFFTFLGGMAGPASFGHMVHAGISHATVYSLLAVLPLGLGLVWLLRSRASPGRA